MHKHTTTSINVSFDVPYANPQAKDLNQEWNASEFARAFEKKFQSRGVRDVMVSGTSDKHKVRVSMRLVSYTIEDPDSKSGETSVFFTERGLDQHFNNFYNNFPWFKFGEDYYLQKNTSN
jgi:hypothetical protein